MFLKVKQTRPDDLKKLVPVAGDVALPNLGLTDEAENLLREKVTLIMIVKMKWKKWFIW